ncbi:MAG: SusC/RagA family TonB-linked outer membrane protein [Gemmatimonadota bacterium]|nr:SusC/RagA family TonB-linked outer membrane protein [Gemmatimonadota bacterium]
MRSISSSRWTGKMVACLTTLVTLAAGASRLGAQQTTISGKITDAQTGAPLAAVQVQIVGTTLGAQSNAEGTYAIRGSASGVVQVRANRIGYAEQKKGVSINPGSVNTVDFALTAAPIELNPVIATATGEQRRLEVGNTVAQISATTVMESSPVTSISDLLQARAPGVQVMSSGVTGAGTRIRIRGTNSLSLLNDPIYIVDGIRIESSSSSASIGVGGTTPSRVNDLTPDEIENIEVLKGPSAATLYGTDAANGVIIITTKRGQAGNAKWTVIGEGGLVTLRSSIPTNYASWGHAPGGTTSSRGCFIAQVASGACIQDSVTNYSPINDPATTFLGNGNRKLFGLQLQGGSETMRYFTSGELENEVGIYKLPDFERTYLSNIGRPMQDYQDRPNALNKGSGRVNLSFQPSQSIDFSMSTNYIKSAERFPQLDNNAASIFARALLGPGYKQKSLSVTGDTLFGYSGFTPADAFEEEVTQDINRFIGSLNGNWRPLNWLSGRSNLGIDFTNRTETDLCRFSTCSPVGTNRQGFKTDNRTNIFQYTLDGSATATFSPRTWLTSRSTVGAQYFENNFNRNGASGTVLPPGGTTVTQTANKNSAEVTTDVRTLGAFAEEALGFRDRLFITAGIRADKNSAFGVNFKAAYYPKVSASWILSDETFFPKPNWLNLFRLRSAYGLSGVRPGNTDALQFFQTNIARLSGTDNVGEIIQQPGNFNLKPETTTEVEAGFDLNTLNSRLNFEFTYYNKNSKDALIQQILAPSAGNGAVSQFYNLGKVTNKGFEALMSAQLIQRPSFGLDVTLSGSHNSNKLVTLGSVPPIIGATVQQRAGYPLNGYWQRPYTYSDANGDGRIAPSEVTVQDSAAFLGYSIPPNEATLSTGIDLFKRVLRVQALVDYKGGHKLYNNTERFKCTDAVNARSRNDVSAPLFDQARCSAAAEVAGTSRTLAGYFEKADFWRLRELSLTYNAPDRWAQRFFRSRKLSATLSARNLYINTKYTGIDPESSSGQTDIPADFLTVPVPSYFIFRINLGY